MRAGSGRSESAVSSAASAELSLLIEPPSWGRTFLCNLADLFLPNREPLLEVASSPATFWPDVFVSRPLPWFRFLESAIFHTAAVAVLWTVSEFGVLQPRAVTKPVFHRSDVVYYSAADYLPSLNTGTVRRPSRQKGDPAYSRQPIISVPLESDNHTQTIVTPPHIQLSHDVPMPNVVAWSRDPVAVVAPAPEISQTSSPRTLALPPSVVAPPPQVANDVAHPAPALPSGVVAPPPQVDLAARRSRLAVPVGVIAPPPNVQAAYAARAGNITLGHAGVIAPSPTVDLPRQFSKGPSAAVAVVPPPPLAERANLQSPGRLIALSVHPAPPSAAAEPPPGNRRGSFAATPEGKPDAGGIPDSAAGTKADQTSSPGPASARGDLPSGLYVGSAPAASDNHSTQAAASENQVATLHPFKLDRFVAAGSMPRVGTMSREPAARPVTNVGELEKKIFHDRRFYSMILNLPNLNSAGGSWVMRFAELKEPRPGELIAPVPTETVDPAYPAELMVENVEGTVTLYAVIHSDGSVGDVRVLESVDDRLDRFAAVALSHWHFRPAMKNGAAVALEAVVHIPFRAIHHGY